MVLSGIVLQVVPDWVNQRRACVWMMSYWTLMLQGLKEGGSTWGNIQTTFPSPEQFFPQALKLFPAADAAAWRVAAVWGSKILEWGEADFP